MAESTKRTVRKGRIYHIRVADVEYRTFIWQTGRSFCGRVEDQPQVQLCRGNTVLVVQALLTAALTASLSPAHSR